MMWVQYISCLLQAVPAIFKLRSANSWHVSAMATSNDRGRCQSVSRRLEHVPSAEFYWRFGYTTACISPNLTLLVLRLDTDTDPRRLRSADTLRTLFVSWTRINLGDRAFSAAGPRVLNSLPTDLRQPDNVPYIFSVSAEKYSMWAAHIHAWAPEFFFTDVTQDNKEISLETHLMSLDLHPVSTLQTKTRSSAAWFPSDVAYITRMTLTITARQFETHARPFLPRARPRSRAA